MNAAAERNHAIYEDLWTHYQLFPHSGWAHAWSEIEPLYANRSHPGDRSLACFRTCRSPERTLSIYRDMALKALSAIKVAYVRCATSPLPYADERFDLVCLFEVLEHVSEDEALLREVARVLRPRRSPVLFLPVQPRLLDVLRQGHGARASLSRQLSWPSDSIAPAS
jgi:SAM-dependent methyltransferase